MKWITRKEVPAEIRHTERKIKNLLVARQETSRRPSADAVKVSSNYISLLLDLEPKDGESYIYISGSELYII